MKNKSTDLIMALLIIVLVVGFYFVLSSVQNVKEDTENLSLNVDLLYEKTVGDTVTPGSSATSTTDSSQDTDSSESISIPTAILFQTQSSPLLSPQTNITVAIESVSKSSDGTVAVDITAYTNNANSFSALQGNNIFELVNLSQGNQKPLKVEGNFDSIPPQSKVQGTITFKVQSSTNQAILQIRSISGLKHYRFNFNNESYEEAILG